MDTTATILIVDDEANIRVSLKEILAQEGYHIVTAHNGQTALTCISSQQFDLVLLDLKLPDMSGIDVLTALRKQSLETVAIVLTAHGSLETSVEALRQGAHDYLFKPCQPAELRESVRKGLLSRRSQIGQRDLLDRLEHLSNNIEDIRASIMEKADDPPIDIGRSEQKQNRFLRKNGLVIDLLHYIVTLDDQLLDLSRTEFDLLTYLVKETPRVVSPQELIREVHGYDVDQWEAADIVRSHIYHIRQKIKKTTGRTDIIRTVRGIGYTIE